MSRADDIQRIRRTLNEAIRRAHAAQDTPRESEETFTLLGEAVGVLREALKLVADLDQEVTALRKEVKRLKKAAK